VNSCSFSNRLLRNLSNPENPVIDPEEYQNRVKEELIKKGLLGENNFIDEWKRKGTEVNPLQITEITADSIIRAGEENKPVNYQGPTRVYFRLENRYHTHLPIPVYKCPTAGKVNVSIEVDRDGSVVAAKIDHTGSTTTDPCLTEAALRSANVTRFNSDATAPPRQEGSITFHFVAQQQD